VVLPTRTAVSYSTAAASVVSSRLCDGPHSCSMTGTRRPLPHHHHVPAAQPVDDRHARPLLHLHPVHRLPIRILVEQHLDRRRLPPNDALPQRPLILLVPQQLLRERHHRPRRRPQRLLPARRPRRLPLRRLLRQTRNFPPPHLRPPARVRPPRRPRRLPLRRLLRQTRNFPRRPLRLIRRPRLRQVP